METLRIENMSFRYPRQETKALDNVSLTVNRGELIVICGQSGCGKSTLLRLIKPSVAPVGEKEGRIWYNGMPQDALEEKTAAADIGYVLQNPDQQIVTDKVWHEMAFGLESLGVPTEEIRRRVGEMAEYFGIQEWFRKSTDALSGGQKQLLNLAAVMVMRPKLLLLDEPTGQLDPIAASDFIMTLQKINRELGVTILLVEHRLEEVFPIADKVLVMDAGRVLLYDSPRAVGEQLRQMPREHPMRYGLPSAMRLFHALGVEDACPLTVREGRDFLERHFSPTPAATAQAPYRHPEKTMVSINNVWFRYERELPDVLRGASLTVYEGEISCILGGNGAGKTTVLNVIAGLDKAYRGDVRVGGKPLKDYPRNALYRRTLAYLPQNPQTVFLTETVRADLAEMLDVMGTPPSQQAAAVQAAAEQYGILPLLDKHPHDLSGGEQQICALAKVLLSQPRILLMDEPTKGLDADARRRLTARLTAWKQQGMTVIIVTHDVEFAAQTADRCALLFDGEILCSDVPSRFFAENYFYTTAANRMARQWWPDVVTCEQVIDRCLAMGEEKQ